MIRCIKTRCFGSFSPISLLVGVLLSLLVTGCPLEQESKEAESSETTDSGVEKTETREKTKTVVSKTSSQKTSSEEIFQDDEEEENSEDEEIVEEDAEDEEDDNSSPVANPTIFYVSAASGDDDNDGSADAPLLTIQAALDLAFETNGHTAASTVRVAEGTYLVKSDAGDFIDLMPRVSMYGGYSEADWAVRNPSVYTTTITDTATAGGTDSSPRKAVYVNGSFYGAIVDGFTINGGGGDYSAAVYRYQSAGLVIQNCNINGGNASSGSYGVFVFSDFGHGSRHINDIITGGSGAVSAAVYIRFDGSLAFDNITMNGGSGVTNYGFYISSTTTHTLSTNNISGGTGTNSYGIKTHNAFPIIQNNTITGGSGSATSYGLYLSPGNGVPHAVLNNSINGGSGATSTGLHLASVHDGQGEIYGNTIHGGSGAVTNYGVNYNSSGVMIQNNVIFGGSGGVTTYGFYTWGVTSAKLYNNTINAGLGSANAYGFHTTFASNQTLYNNIFFASGNGNKYCIATVMGAPATFIAKNNALFSCKPYKTWSYCSGNGDGDGDSTTCTLAEMETLDGADDSASGNTTQAAAFVSAAGADNNISTMADNDWRLDGSTHDNIRQGGIDGVAGGWDFGDDFDLIVRSANITASPSNEDAGGWSMGAFEKD